MFQSWSAASQSGWTNSIPMALRCPLSNVMAAVFTIPLLACSSVPLDMTGMMRGSTHFLASWMVCSRSRIVRVRTKLREADSEYDYTIDLCLHCFYWGFKGSRDNPEKGFLQSSLLIKVYWMGLYVAKLIPVHRPSSIFLHRLRLLMTSPFSTTMRTMQRISNHPRKPVAQKLARRPTHERQLRPIFRWLGLLHGQLPMRQCRY
jgi:hypothetical protein